ncbi:MAG: hypothetical protein FJ123_00040 [Deltaproteobacteria bacterium]|nr:hypothetical protein [Deltaproteobacteria bacterium]
MDQKRNKLLDQTKQALRRIGLPIIQEKSLQGGWDISTGVVHFDNGPAEILAVSYDAKPEYILISDRLAYLIPKEKVGDTLEIINELNMFQVAGTFYLDRKASTLGVSDGFYVNESELDKVTFEKPLLMVIKKGENLFPMIMDLFEGRKGKEEILEEIELSKKEAIRNGKI